MGFGYWQHRLVRLMQWLKIWRVAITGCSSIQRWCILKAVRIYCGNLRLVFVVATAVGQWQLITRAIAAIRNQVGTARVICGLSGGVDSSVAAILIHEAIGDQLTCVFVDWVATRR